MRILAVTRYDPFLTLFGTEVFARNLIYELIRLGIETSVICESHNHYSLTNSEFRRHLIKDVKLPLIDGIHFFVKASNICKNLMRKIDVIVGFGAGSFAGYIFKNLKYENEKPLLIYYAIDSAYSEFRRKQSSLSKRGLRVKLRNYVFYKAITHLDKTGCLNSDLVCSSSGDTARSLVKYYSIPGNKIKICYFGVPKDFGEDLKIHDPALPTFLHVAIDPERKGTVFFLEALKILKDRYGINAKGVVAGNKDIFYTNLANKTEIDVSFLGRIQQKELKKLYASCTSLVVSSVSEGFCLPVIEAGIMGKPSIVTKIGSLPELVKNRVNGLVVPPADSESLAYAMYTIVNDVKLRKIMSTNAKLSSRKFKIDVTAKRFLNILNSLL